MKRSPVTAAAVAALFVLFASPAGSSAPTPMVLSGATAGPVAGARAGVEIERERGAAPAEPVSVTMVESETVQAGEGVLVDDGAAEHGAAVLGPATQITRPAPARTSNQHAGTLADAGTEGVVIVSPVELVDATSDPESDPADLSGVWEHPVHNHASFEYDAATLTTATQASSTTAERTAPLFVQVHATATGGQIDVVVLAHPTRGPVTVTDMTVTVVVADPTGHTYTTQVTVGEALVTDAGVTLRGVVALDADVAGVYEVAGTAVYTID